MDLPEAYYLLHFETLVEDACGRYGDLLRPEERNRVEAYRGLPRGSRCLLVRMLLRRGPWFPEQSLRYAEVGDPAPFLVQLVTAGFCLGPDEAPLEALLPLLTRQDLARHLAALGIAHPRSAKRGDLEALLRTQEGLLERLRGELRPVSLAQEGLWTLLAFLFFGNFEQDLSSFVVAELGHVRYADYAVDPEARLFQSREDVDFLLSIRDLKEELGTHPEALPRITEAALALAPHPGIRQQRRYQGLLNELGRAWERLGDNTSALACYSRSERPPARERRVRVMAAQGRLEEALSLALELAEGPLDQGEARFARIFLHRHHRQCPAAQAWLETHRAPDPPVERRIVLEHPPLGRVEEAALEAARAEGWEGFFAENHLWRALFGLVFWDELFAPVPGAFQHRFQNAPLDIQGFYEPRQKDIEARLTELTGGGSPLRLILGNADRHWGTACRFLSWKHLDRADLCAAVTRIPPALLARVLGTMARNPLAFDSGFPDLFLYRPGDEAWSLWEIKGPGDALRPEQAWWLEQFRAAGASAWVVRVDWKKPVASRPAFLDTSFGYP